MANFYAQNLKAKSIYILDNSGAYGVSLANSFEKQAAKLGLKILDREQLNPKEADYTTVLTKIKAVKPDAIYCGCDAQAGVKFAKQAYDIIPNVLKGGGDGIAGGAFLKGVGFPAVESWYSTNASPHLTEDPAVANSVKNYVAKYGSQPSDYSITAYDAALIIIDAIKRTAESGKAVNRSNVRDAIQSANLNTLQGVVSFDENGDIKDRTVSVFQYRKSAQFPEDDILHQQHYEGVAPQNSVDRQNEQEDKRAPRARRRIRPSRRAMHREPGSLQRRANSEQWSGAYLLPCRRCSFVEILATRSLVMWRN